MPLKIYLSPIPSRINTGDSISLAITLKKSGAVFAIDTAAEVKAALVSSDDTTAYTEPVLQSEPPLVPIGMSRR